MQAVEKKKCKKKKSLTRKVSSKKSLKRSEESN